MNVYIVTTLTLLHSAVTKYTLQCLHSSLICGGKNSGNIQLMHIRKVHIFNWMMIQFISKAWNAPDHREAMPDTRRSYRRFIGRLLTAALTIALKINRPSVRRVIIPCNADMVIPPIKRRRDAAACSFTLFPAVIVRDSAATHLARIAGELGSHADNAG